ncbi:ankyrin repeat-containing domain protein [Xylaria bambusicola]|uniref:ankyrin repeat-containing domain protein n=1 Tax=Xylaria bambusicola TaxID=326684 RepID=UPI002007F6F2|nr:ankyrin repeat-containing domain protein [Xylaria bambusicola]KAI0508433.1 ankyrin repeat-containing domain protein [Xylaria bambusicola]
MGITHILDLPTELFTKILVFSILARSLSRQHPDRGVARALRLKLVSKAFYHAFQPALFESRVLDDFGSGERLAPWPIRRHYGADQLWQSYLVFRVNNAVDRNVGGFVMIRETARELCKLTGAQYDETVAGLCGLVLDSKDICPRLFEDWGDMFRRRVPATHPRLNLLSAAAYFGHLDLAKQLLEDGCCPTHDQLFPCAMHLAAFAGHTEIVLLCQEYLPPLDEEYTGNAFTDWKVNTGLIAVDGAALRGDVDMLRILISPPPRPGLREDRFTGLDLFDDVNYNRNGRQVLANALLMTRSWDVLQYLKSILYSLFPLDAARLLTENAHRGNKEIVQHILDSEWLLTEDINRLTIDPLTFATWGYHEDIVELLLERGMDPNEFNHINRATPLTAAAGVGSMRMLRKLMERGANCDGDKRQQMEMLRCALLLEHTEMVNFFYDQGLLGRKCPELIRKRIEAVGLESMMELLKKWG